MHAHTLSLSPTGTVGPTWDEDSSEGHLSQAGLMAVLCLFFSLVNSDKSAYWIKERPMRRGERVKLPEKQRPLDSLRELLPALNSLLKRGPPRQIHDLLGPGPSSLSLLWAEVPPLKWAILGDGAKLELDMAYLGSCAINWTEPLNTKLILSFIFSLIICLKRSGWAEERFLNSDSAWKLQIERGYSQL